MNKRQSTAVLLAALFLFAAATPAFAGEYHQSLLCFLPLHPSHSDPFIPMIFPIQEDVASRTSSQSVSSLRVSRKLIRPPDGALLPKPQTLMTALRQAPLRTILAPPTTHRPTSYLDPPPSQTLSTSPVSSTILRALLAETPSLWQSSSTSETSLSLFRSSLISRDRLTQLQIFSPPATSSAVQP